MRRFNLAIGALALLSLLGTRPAASQVPVTSTEIKTPLHLLGLGGMLVVSAVETLEDGPPIDIDVRFFDGRDVLVKEVLDRTFGPGRPLIVNVTRGELRSPERLAPVRAVVNISRPGGFAFNQAAVRFELFDKAAAVGCGTSCSICARVGPEDMACTEELGRGHGPATLCLGSAFVSNVNVE